MKSKAMIAGSLHENLRFYPGQRFFILYGPGIIGRSLPLDYAELGIEGGSET